MPLHAASKFLHSWLRAVHDVGACCWLQVLLALAGHKTPHSRKRFQQLSVMDFFVREVSTYLIAEQLSMRQGIMLGLMWGVRTLWLLHASPAARFSLWRSEAGSNAKTMSRPISRTFWFCLIAAPLCYHAGEPGV